MSKLEYITNKVSDICLVGILSGAASGTIARGATYYINKDLSDNFLDYGFKILLLSAGIAVINEMFVPKPKGYDPDQEEI
jgi:hypothetical protein